jgi:hypothetical protein
MKETNRKENDMNTPVTTNRQRYWKPRLGFYRDRKALRFPNNEERVKALHLVWHDDELFGLPRNHADGDTLIVPAEAVDVFRRKGINFVVLEVSPAVRVKRHT